MGSAQIDTLRGLHTDAIDAMNGYDEALKDSDGHSVFSLFRKMKELHQVAAGQLAAEMARSGEAPGDDRSFMSTIHESIMKLRSLIGGLDDSVLPGLIDGEQRNLKKYDEALQSGSLDTAALTVVKEQRRRLEAEITLMKADAPK